MSDLSWHPRVVCYAERRESSMVYFGPHDQSEITGEADLQQALLHLCTGHQTAEEIIGMLARDYEDAQAMELLSVLRELNIVVDARNCWRGYHVFGSNPMPFFAPPSDEQLRCLHRARAYREAMDCGDSNLLQLLCRRLSTRDFAHGALTYDEILQIARTGYGVTGAIDIMGESIGRRTVPSAGALYPLSIHVIIRRSAPEDCRGIFVFDGIRLNLVEATFEDRRWQSCFLDDVAVSLVAADPTVAENPAANP